MAEFDLGEDPSRTPVVMIYVGLVVVDSLFNRFLKLALSLIMIVGRFFNLTSSLFSGSGSGLFSYC